MQPPWQHHGHVCTDAGEGNTEVVDLCSARCDMGKFRPSVPLDLMIPVLCPTVIDGHGVTGVCGIDTGQVTSTLTE